MGGGGLGEGEGHSNPGPFQAAIVAIMLGRRTGIEINEDPGGARRPCYTARRQDPRALLLLGRLRVFGLGICMPGRHGTEGRGPGRENLTEGVVRCGCSD
jgi:hypothetical protein